MELDCAAQPDYQVTKAMHAQNVADWQGDILMPHCYDRISWFTHMVYRLALPDREWHDEAVRTVFGMPDTHLVVKLHKPELSDFNEAAPDSRTGLVIDTPVARVNPVYWAMTETLMRLNAFQGYDLFRSISIIEVMNTPEGYSQHLVAHDNPSWDREPGWELLHRMVTTNQDLLNFLQDVEQRLA